MTRLLLPQEIAEEAAEVAAAAARAAVAGALSGPGGGGGGGAEFPLHLQVAEPFGEPLAVPFGEQRHLEVCHENVDPPPFVPAAAPAPAAPAPAGPAPVVMPAAGPGLSAGGRRLPPSIAKSAGAGRASVFSINEGLGTKKQG